MISEGICKFIKACVVATCEGQSNQMSGWSWCGVAVLSPCGSAVRCCEQVLFLQFLLSLQSSFAACIAVLRRVHVCDTVM